MVEAIGAAVGQVGDESVLPGEGGQDLLCVLVPGDFSGHIHGELISQAHHRQEFPLAGGQGVDHGGGEHGINVRAAVGQGPPLGQSAQVQIDGGEPPLAGIEQGLDLRLRELGPASVGIDGQLRVVQPQLVRADETQPPPQADGLLRGEEAVPAGHDQVDGLGQPVGQGTQKGGGSAIGEQMEVVDEDVPGDLPGKGPAQVVRQQTGPGVVGGAGAVGQKAQPGVDKGVLHALPEDGQVVGIDADPDDMDRPLLGALGQIPVHRRGLAIAHGGHHYGQPAAGDGPQALLQSLRDVDGIQIALPLRHSSVLRF